MKTACAPNSKSLNSGYIYDSQTSSEVQNMPRLSLKFTKLLAVDPTEGGHTTRTLSLRPTVETRIETVVSTHATSTIFADR